MKKILVFAAMAAVFVLILWATRTETKMTTATITETETVEAAVTSAQEFSKPNGSDNPTSARDSRLRAAGLSPVAIHAVTVKTK